MPNNLEFEECGAALIKYMPVNCLGFIWDRLRLCAFDSVRARWIYLDQSRVSFLHEQYYVDWPVPLCTFYELLQFIVCRRTNDIVWSICQFTGGYLLLQNDGGKGAFGGGLEKSGEIV